jgi:hypothetical protein
MKTLKYEEVCCNEYRELAEARAAIGEFLEREPITRNACIRRWATCRPLSSRRNWRRKLRRPLRGSCLYEFSEAWEISLENTSA